MDNLTTIELERRSHATWIWMNRPESHNAFDATLIAELNAVLIALNQDDNVRAIVLTARGKSFSAGADLNWMREQGQATIEENIQDAQKLGEMLLRLYRMDKPVIARVQGPAIGGGMGLAAACTICIASSEAVFATSEVRLGLAPSAISPYVLRAIGARQAQRYFLTAERIRADRALDLGLVHVVVDDAALDGQVDHVINDLLRGGPSALAVSMHLIRDFAHATPSHAVMVETAERIAHLRATEEAREGVSAFLEKRVPRWHANLENMERQ